MKRLTLLSLVLVGLSLAAWDASAPRSDQPRVDPPLPAQTAPRVTSFPMDHPDWRVLREPHADATALRFEHQVHMNPDTPRMQTALQTFADSRRKAGVPSSKLGIEPASTSTANASKRLSCVACHVTDDAGRYMQPIVFERHCQACHSLGQREGQDIPHGKEAAEFLRRITAENVLTPKPAATEPAPTPTSGGPRRRPAAPVAATQHQPVTFESELAMTRALQERLTTERERVTRAVKSSCVVCHGPDAEPGAVTDPSIPDRWLPRSVFSHNAHGYVRCDQCHAQASTPATPVQASAPTVSTAGTWTGRTADVMLPNIESCRSCHSPKAGVRSDCVTCHSYHQK